MVPRMFLLYCALAYFAGLTLGRLAWSAGFMSCGFPPWLWMGPLLLLPFVSLINRWQTSPDASPLRWPQSAGFRPPPSTLWTRGLLTALALCALGGALRYAANPLTPCWDETDLAFYNLPADRAFDDSAPDVRLEGYVSSYPLVDGTRQRFHVTVTKLTGAGQVQVIDGVLRLTTSAEARYVYGQPLRIRGRLTTPPVFEDFSYREYLARKGVHSLLYSAQITPMAGPRQGRAYLRAVYGFRARGENALNRLLPEPYAALANGMLLGIEAAIPDDLYDQFNLTGTSHVIVISGSNVALISGLIMALAARLLGRRRAVLPTLAAIGLYALLVGGDAAVMRAALMGGLFVTALALNRSSTALVSLAAACWAMTLVNPLTLWDVGFQLSSAATAGLILFSPAITAGFGRLVPGFGGPLLAESGASAQALTVRTQSLARGLVEDGLLVTIAANVTTLPLVVYYFGRLSVVSLLTNLLISPVQPYIMLWGSGGVLAGAAGLDWLAQPLLWIPWFSLVWTVAMVRWTAALPGASLAVSSYGLGALILTYAVIFGMHWRGQLSEGGHSLLRRLHAGALVRLAGPATAGVLAVLALLLWRMALTQPDGRLHVHFLDIGQGDGILIATPSGRQLLIDGGAEPERLLGELGATLPFWDRTIDVLLLTHPDADHMAGQTSVPGRFNVTYALDTPVSRADPAAEIWRERVARGGAKLVAQEADGWIDLGDGVGLWILWPPPGGFEHEHADNENSLVAKLVYGDFSVLLTGDAGLPSEDVWLAQDAPVQAAVLKVGHHGSSSATSPEFVEAVDPAVAVIQVGADNDYGHPAQEVLATLDGRLVLRNDQAGRITISSDGRRMWIREEAK
ncbi:MAG: ComEC/Rec2 family competence protein [Caldilineaceae bacterium]|nr:ComEC/Rec2 family competence protein [Caldilineaceae bacterium]